MDHGRPYADRSAAGRVLADALVSALAEHDRDPGPPLVLALPRGGVPVAVPVAEALTAELSVLVVRKLGAPGQPELAVGAIALIGEHVVRVLNDQWVRRLRLSAERLSIMVDTETEELRARATVLGTTPPVAGRTVIVVDDGLATGATPSSPAGRWPVPTGTPGRTAGTTSATSPNSPVTAAGGTAATRRAAVTAGRGADAGYVVVAVPVGAAGACQELAEVADLVVCPRQPYPFRAVGEHYQDFAQLNDDDVLALLR